MSDPKSPQITRKRESDLNQRLLPVKIVHINEPANNMDFFHWHEFMELSYVLEVRDLEEILRFINSSFSKDIGLGSVVQRFFMSAAYFSDFFKKNIGINFSDYLTRTRISEVIRRYDGSAILR
jgi:YesN/AraC family two-component response regulator